MKAFEASFSFQLGLGISQTVLVSNFSPRTLITAEREELSDVPMVPPLWKWDGEGRKIEFVLQDFRGTTRHAWSAGIERSDPEVIVLRAIATRQRVFDKITIEPEDRLRMYVPRREWFTINEYLTPDGRVNGWYCNIARPPEISDSRIVSQDLLLDIVVLPNGDNSVLDEDELSVASEHLGQSDVTTIEETKRKLLVMIQNRQGLFAQISAP